MREMLIPNSPIFARCAKGETFYHSNREYLILDTSFPIDIGDNMEISALLVEYKEELIIAIPLQTKYRILQSEGYRLELPFASVPFIYPSI